MPKQLKQLNEYPKEELQKARADVAKDWREIAHSVRKNDEYASHVSESKKDELLTKALNTADEIEAGKLDHQFWAWQRINQKLTGECVPLFQLY